LGLFFWAWRRPLVSCASLLLVATSAVALNIRHQLWDSQAMTARLELKAIANGVEVYRSDTGSPPSRLEDLVPKYARDLHRDPWGNNYAFYRGAGGVAIVSAGPDGQLGTADDIIKISPK
jgi:hypothetical protein